MSAPDLSQLSMHDLFRLETENQTQVMTSGLLALERNPTAANHLEACMRAAHSLKGAARLVDIDAGVALAHGMEDFLVACQDGRITLDQVRIDLLLEGVDLMMAITRTPDLAPGQSAGSRRQDVDAFVANLARILEQQGFAQPGSAEASEAPASPDLPDEPELQTVPDAQVERETSERE